MTAVMNKLIGKRRTGIWYMFLSPTVFSMDTLLMQNGIKNISYLKKVDVDLK